MLYKETVSKQMWELLHKLMRDENLKDFNLVGGTALSLRLGHRLSVDLDLFTTTDFDSKKLFSYLNDAYDVQSKDSLLFNNSIMTYINDIKVDFITHGYPLLNPVEENEGVRMLSNEDIGAMKLHAIFQSGERLKDFVDIYFLLADQPLNHYIEAYQRKYSSPGFLAAYALTYFGNIDRNTNISMMKGKEHRWTRISERLQKAVNNPEMNFGNRKKQENENKPPKKGRGFRP